MTDKTRTWVVLLRGINVNPSTRIAMADLRALLEELGFESVRTLLQSGNVVLESQKKPDAAAIEAAILDATTVRSGVVVLDPKTYRAIVEANPLEDDAPDLSRAVISFTSSRFDAAKVDRPTDAVLAPERLVITTDAIYQWIPDGILKTKLPPAFWRQFSPVVTTRNVRTARRLLALLP